MKAIMLFLLLLGLSPACRRSENAMCHAQLHAELVMPVYLVGTPAYKEYERYSMHCAGKCPDGTPCDSIIELSTISGTHYKILRCGCKNQTDNSCNIALERFWNHPDTIHSLLLCLGSANCPTIDTCVTSTRTLSPDTIRSRLTGRDSIILNKKVITCECQ